MKFSQWGDSERFGFATLIADSVTLCVAQVMAEHPDAGRQAVHMDQPVRVSAVHVHDKQ